MIHYNLYGDSKCFDFSVRKIISSVLRTVKKLESLNTEHIMSIILVDNNNHLRNDIELLDSWTPITYNDYFNSYYGSYMGFVLKKNNKFDNISPKIKDIKNLYYISYWQKPTGGLPIAAKLGEDVCKYL